MPAPSARAAVHPRPRSSAAWDTFPILQLAMVPGTFNGSSACFTIKRFDNVARVGWILSYEDVVRVNERGGFSVFVEERKR